MSVTTIQQAGRGNALTNALIIARRNLLHIKASPEQLVDMTIQPLMFLVLFVFVFGGAIAGSSRDYVQFFLPGILVQGTAFTPITTALGLNKDFHQGIIDRFRSLPIARSAVISGRIVAEAVRPPGGAPVMGGVWGLLGVR